MDLMDDSGEIRVTAFKEQCDQFFDKAIVGKVVYISNCSVKNANKQYSKLNNEYELTFKDNGMMELAEDTGDIPTVTYNFVAINDLTGCAKDSNVDVIGVVKVSGDATTITTKAGKELVKREITLVDKSSTQVTLTLWGSTAETFDPSYNPIVAAKGVRVSGELLMFILLFFTIIPSGQTSMASVSLVETSWSTLTWTWLTSSRVGGTRTAAGRR